MQYYSFHWFIHVLVNFIWLALNFVGHKAFCALSQILQIPFSAEHALHTKI
jgi:hypothetical protein